MRLIDADALKERAIRVSTVKELGNKEHCYIKAVGTHEIDKAPTVDAFSWIPVTERLPDKHGKTYVCWLTFPNGGAFSHILIWHEYGDNGYVNGKHFSDEGLDGMKVTHWMPLPEPPKGE